MSLILGLHMSQYMHEYLFFGFFNLKHSMTKTCKIGAFCLVVMMGALSTLSLAGLKMDMW